MSEKIKRRDGKLLFSHKGFDIIISEWDEGSKSRHEYPERKDVSKVGDRRDP